MKREKTVKRGPMAYELLGKDGFWTPRSGKSLASQTRRS